MLTVRNILAVSICVSPIMLLWDGLIVQGVVAGIAAVTLAIAARALRPGETGFLISVTRPPLAAAAIPALWVLLQVIPFGVLAHPIWRSAETALHYAVAGAISADPGASVIALGRYLSMTAVAFLSAAVAIDRQRAEWMLFALSVAATIVSLIVIAQSLLPPGSWLAAFARPPAIDGAGLGSIIAGAACIRAVERYETRHAQQRSKPNVLQTFAPCTIALAICLAALTLSAKAEVICATGYGLLALACQLIIRRFGLGLLGMAGMVVPALGIAVLLVAGHPAQRGIGLPLAFADPSAPSLTALSQRMLDDAPLVGTGAGTFAALAPIYRQMEEPPSGPTAATAAGALAIELGKPMLWLIAAATVGFVVMFLRASLQRGRDSFYSAMGGSCLFTVLLLAFTNAGLFGTTVGLIVAAALGLAFAQSKSRMVQI